MARGCGSVPRAAWRKTLAEQLVHRVRSRSVVPSNDISDKDSKTETVLTRGGGASRAGATRQSGQWSFGCAEAKKCLIYGPPPPPHAEQEGLVRVTRHLQPHQAGSCQLGWASSLEAAPPRGWGGQRTGSCGWTPLSPPVTGPCGCCPDKRCRRPGGFITRGFCCHGAGGLTGSHSL